MQRTRIQPRSAGPIAAAVATGLVLAIGATRLQGALVQGEASRQPSLRVVSPEQAALLPVVVMASEEGPCSITGVAEGADSHAVYLTALRYERRGASWVVSDYVNVDLGSGRAFVIQGLSPGLWFVAARGFAGDEPACGRSEAIVLSSSEPCTQTAVTLESFQVHVVVEGVPEDLADEVSLSLDWVERDRIQVEADEFLDLPDDACPRTDAFQVFGSLESVGPIWMVEGPREDPAQELDAPLDPRVDPWGWKHSHRSWIAPSLDGPLPLVVPGPGSVRVTLHGIPGAWASTVLSADLEPGAAIKVLRFSLDAAALGSRAQSF